MSLQVFLFHPVVDHPGIAPAHASVFVGVNLQEQAPVHSSFRELGDTWVTVVGIGNGDAMRGQLALLAHIILNGVGMAEQAVVNGSAVGWTGKCGEEIFVFLLLIVCPVEVGYVKLRVLSEGHLAGKAQRTSLDRKSV